MLVLGLDPGLSGAYALLRDGNIVCSADLPRIGDGAQSRIQGSLFAAVVRDLAPDVAVIEEVASRPGEGGASIFKFGRAVGALEGILAACDVPVHRVTPSRWKGHFRLPGKAKGGEEASRQRAMELWPTHAALFARKMDHHRADSALIARWFFETAFRREAA
jgi:hypothetical protein